MSTFLIGVPTFNRPRLVRETLASLQAQSLGDWRAIVSDNASAPTAAADVRAYVEGLGDPRISYVLQAINGGEYGQGRFFERQIGGEEYFLILHDDDLLQPDYLERAKEALDARPQTAIYLADPEIIDENARLRPDQTAWYRTYHGRGGAARSVPVIDRVLADGFFPISGTIFRARAVLEAGLVDPDLQGNYPFELNVFLRQTERNAEAWYDPRPALRFRMHPNALRHTDRLMENPSVVDAMIALLARRRFLGAVERRRRAVLGRLHRARALMALRAGNVGESRAAIAAALRTCWRSKHTLAAAFAIACFPQRFRRRLPDAEPVALPPQREVAPSMHG